MATEVAACPTSVTAQTTIHQHSNRFTKGSN